MLHLDLTGKRALIAGLADDRGYAFAIAKALVEAGATVCVAAWPPAYGLFLRLLESGRLDPSLQLADGQRMSFERVYPFDAEFDHADEVPARLSASRPYVGLGDVSTGGLVARLKQDFGESCLDIVVHSLANGPEVKSPLLDTSRSGYTSAVSVSAYSFVSLVKHLGPIARRGAAFLALSYLAGERVVPAYGGGLSSAKAALENDARMLAYEAGRRWGHRVNVISAGPLASRAASAIGPIERMISYCEVNSPLRQRTTAAQVGNAAAFLLSPLADGITGATVFVDCGYNIMGMAVEQPP